MTSPYKLETRHHPLGKTCHHFTHYRLTCDEYDSMRARAGGHCEICGIAEEETPRGTLVIDHFQGRRCIVIRGLLCDTCNAGVMRCVDGTRVWGPRARSLERQARAYDGNPWQEPSEEAREELAARTELLSKFDPRYERPKREYVASRSAPVRRVESIRIPLGRGPAVIAQRLRRHLTVQQLERLALLLSGNE